MKERPKELRIAKDYRLNPEMARLLKQNNINTPSNNT
jgi:hypothetical protein